MFEGGDTTAVKTETTSFSDINSYFLYNVYDHVLTIIKLTLLIEEERLITRSLRADVSLLNRLSTFITYLYHSYGGFLLYFIILKKIRRSILAFC